VTFFKIILSVLLIIGIFNPKMPWKMSEGWKFKEDIEPSATYIVVNVIGSIVILIVMWFDNFEWK
jgi:hypothetical protein